MITIQPYVSFTSYILFVADIVISYNGRQVEVLEHIVITVLNYQFYTLYVTISISSLRLQIREKLLAIF